MRHNDGDELLSYLQMRFGPRAEITNQGNAGRLKTGTDGNDQGNNFPNDKLLYGSAAWRLKARPRLWASIHAREGGEALHEMG